MHIKATTVSILMIIFIIIVVVIAVSVSIFQLLGILPDRDCIRIEPTVLLSTDNITANSGTTVSYTSQIINKDSSECPISSFILTSSVPVGWSYNFSKNNFELKSGENTTVDFFVLSPFSAELGTYNATIKVTNTNSGLYGSGSVNYISICTDSDGAYDNTNETVFRIRGTCKDSTGNYTDLCDSTYIVHDYSCDSFGECTSKVGFNCGIFGRDFVCSEGACKRQFNP